MAGSLHVVVSEGFIVGGFHKFALADFETIFEIKALANEGVMRA